MATCLRCDGCGAFVTENDEELPRWWTVERYGSEWISGPGDDPRNAMGSEISFMPVIMGVPFSGEIEVTPEAIEDMEEMMVEEYIEDSGGIAVGLTLHFCKAACLAAWAGQAAAFEE